MLLQQKQQQQQQQASSLGGPASSTSISGRSRFSKALPSVPGLLDDAPPLPMPKELPDLPPPPPYAKDDDSKSIKSTIARKPVKSSPLPPPPPPPKPATPALKTPLQPSSSTSTTSISTTSTTSITSSISTSSTNTGSSASSSSSTAPTPTSAMAIPRRPVGALQPPPPAKPLQYLPQPSPTDSLSSLLSAYSREPEGPPFGRGTSASATGGGSTTYTVHAAERRTSPAGNPTAAPAAPTAVGSSLRTSPPRHQKLPAPPPKDDKPLPSPRPASPSSKPQPALPELATPSPPRPEIWRRRPHKSENSRELPELKLDYSHGSTASTNTAQLPLPATTTAAAAVAAATPSSGSGSSRSQASQRSQGSTETIKATPTPQPRPAVVGLPGRNVRPAAKQQQPQQQQSQQPKQQQQQQQVVETPPAMGNGTSKLNHYKDNLLRSQSPGKDARATKNGHAPSRPGAQRPPTPEYHKEDLKAAPALDTFVSPVSPASSSGSPKVVPADAFSRALPPHSLGDAVEQPQSKPLPRKTLPPSAPNLHGATSLQDLINKNSSAQTPADDGSPGRAREPAGSAKFPPRSSSARPEAPRPVERPRRSAPDGADPRIVHSDTQGPLYRGRDGTLYPEMRNTREPDPRAAYFPVQAEKALEPGAVIPARPLKGSHFSCYQSHRTMNRRTNRHCPLTCQTCDKADVEDRWVCTFCHLRICESCLRALNGHQRVLRRLVDELAMNTPLSLSSMSRPGSPLALQLAT